MLDMGVSPDRIIFANPCKQTSFIKCVIFFLIFFFLKCIELFTFDIIRSECCKCLIWMLQLSFLLLVFITHKQIDCKVLLWKLWDSALFWQVLVAYFYPGFLSFMEGNLLQESYYTKNYFASLLLWKNSIPMNKTEEFNELTSTSVLICFMSAMQRQLDIYFIVSIADMQQWIMWKWWHSTMNLNCIR